MSNSVHKRHKLLTFTRQGQNRKYLFKIYDFSKAKLSKVEYLKNALLQNLNDLHRATTFLLVTLLHR